MREDERQQPFRLHSRRLSQGTDHCFLDDSRDSGNTRPTTIMAIKEMYLTKVTLLSQICYKSGTIKFH